MYLVKFQQICSSVARQTIVKVKIKLLILQSHTDTMSGAIKKSYQKTSPTKRNASMVKSPNKNKKSSFFGQSASKKKCLMHEVPSTSSAAASSERPRRVVKEGWLQKRGEHIKNWRSRYFILKDDGSLRGYKGKNLLNNFTVRNCDIMTVDKPKPYTFLMRGLHQSSVVERMFHVKTSQERDEWVTSIKSVALALMDEDARKARKSPAGNEEAASSSASSSSSSSEESRAGIPTSKSCEDLTKKFNVQGVSESSSGKPKTTLENFEFLKVLGRGTFGKVILCRDKRTSEFYALKVLKKSVIIETNEVTHTLTERRVMGRTRHPFLISLRCSFQTPNNLCYVMEYANGGDLFYHLSTSRFFTEDRTRFYAAEVVEAIGYLHGYGIIYRDVKLENILLDKDGHVKVADFGLCKEDITYGTTTKTFCGTPEYIAPEILEDQDYGAAVDWWGLGIVIYEMLCGRLPFYKQNHEELFMTILSETVKYPSTLSSNAVDLLKGLLEKDPAQRLGAGPSDADELKDHAFFAPIDWRELLERKIEPPFKPEVTSATDTRYFDQEFTGESVELTPPKKSSYLGSQQLDNIAEEDELFSDFCYEFSNSSNINDDQRLDSM